MQAVTSIADVRRTVREARAAGKTVGLVPTMGALHEGHFSLIDAARRECGFVVVSIFVNPAQFGPGEDLDAYPRTPDQDVEGCRKRGVDLVFMPAPAEMYPEGAPLTELNVPALAQTLCGRSRPTHFAGVCIAVAKLLNIVAPDRAYFGAKDHQQAAIIRRMATDLAFPVEIVTCPILREPDGLAMSSRNEYLSPTERAQAAALSGALRMAERMIRRDRPSAKRVIEAVRSYLAEHAPAGKVDYIQIVDPATLRDVESTDGSVTIALAVKFGRTRLIDNATVDDADGAG